MKKTVDCTAEAADLEKNGTVSVKTLLEKKLQLTRRQISRLKFTDGLSVNGMKVYVCDRLEPGDVLHIEFNEEETGICAQGTSMPVILYEDEDLVIVNKPAGIPVHPVHGHQDDTLGSILQRYYAAKHQSLIIRPVGRLDKDVTGVMVYAKNQVSAARLNMQRQSGALKKTYLAEGQGEAEEKTGIYTDHIFRIEGNRQREISEKGSLCILHYEVLSAGMMDCLPFILMKIQIETGRTHQIRAQMAHHGHPLFGDELYGGYCISMIRPALHCMHISLHQPFTDKIIEAEAPVPEDMQCFIDH